MRSDQLSELARREMRNTLIFMGTPGWVGKKPMPVEPTYELIEAIHPGLYDELTRRIHKARVYDAEVVQENWDEVETRLLQDGEEAILDDLVSIGEATRP